MMSDVEALGKIAERKDDGMAKKTKKQNQKMQSWIEARKRHHLSHAQVQMARELGMNPAKLGKIDNRVGRIPIWNSAIARPAAL